MLYKEFSKKLVEDLLGTRVCEMTEFQGNSIVLSEEGDVYVNKKLTSFLTIDEAKEFIVHEMLEEEICNELYEDIPDIMIADIINQHHGIKVTDTLIESYLDLAASKTFTLDPAVIDIREFNSIGSSLNNKIDYVLEDGSVIAIDESTHEALNSILNDKYELINYMRESKDNFMHVIRELN